MADTPIPKPRRPTIEIEGIPDHATQTAIKILDARQKRLDWKFILSAVTALSSLGFFSMRDGCSYVTKDVHAADMKLLRDDMTAGFDAVTNRLDRLLAPVKPKGKKMSDGFPNGETSLDAEQPAEKRSRERDQALEEAITKLASATDAGLQAVSRQMRSMRDEVAAVQADQRKMAEHMSSLFSEQGGVMGKLNELCNALSDVKQAVDETPKTRRRK